MDKEQALNQLWNQFEIRAQDVNIVPYDAILPRITYEVWVEEDGVHIVRKGNR